MVACVWFHVPEFVEADNLFLSSSDLIWSFRNVISFATKLCHQDTEHLLDDQLGVLLDFFKSEHKLVGNWAATASSHMLVSARH